MSIADTILRACHFSSILCGEEPPYRNPLVEPTKLTDLFDCNHHNSLQLRRYDHYNIHYSALNTTPAPTHIRISITDLLNTRTSSFSFYFSSNASSNASSDSVIKRPTRSDLSRDDPIAIRALSAHGGLTQVEIARRTPYPIDQVRRACNVPSTPQKNKPHRTGVEFARQKSNISSSGCRLARIGVFPSRIYLFYPPPLNSFGNYTAVNDGSNQQLRLPQITTVSCKSTGFPADSGGDVSVHGNIDRVLCQRFELVRERCDAIC